MNSKYRLETSKDKYKTILSNQLKNKTISMKKFKKEIKDLKKMGILMICLFNVQLIFGQTFISPIGYNNNDGQQRKEVCKWISKEVHDRIGLDNIDDEVNNDVAYNVIHNEVNKEIEAFIQLTEVDDTILLKNKIKMCQELNIINYQDILYAYNLNK